MSTHFEGLGDKWLCLLDEPGAELPGLAAHVGREGSMKPSWKVDGPTTETMLLAYPAEAVVRGAIIVSGDHGEKLDIKTIFPLLEGLPNDLTVDEVHAWKSGFEGESSGIRNEGGEPLWFYNPMLFRDRQRLTPGVRHTFMLAGMCMGVRPALLEELTTSQGPMYEEYVCGWLSENPGKTRLDAPQFKVSLSGSRILAVGQHYSDYQIRAPITSVQETFFGQHKIYMLHMQFGLNTPCPLDIMLYAPAKCCGKLKPAPGDEIDAYVWLQGRIADESSL
jgi:hypothetical protein